MTLKECYAAMNGDYDDVLSRLRTERLVQKFVLKFLADDSYQLLRKSLDEQDYSEAFRAAHTMKGICQNLSITGLGKSSAELTEALRNGWTPEAAGLIEQVTQDYAAVSDAIQTFQSSLNS